jgi:hypothetical protein
VCLEGGIGPSSVGMPRALILQADRQLEGAPVVGEAGGREGRRTEHAFDIVGKTVAFRGDPQAVGVQLAVLECPRIVSRI